MAHPYQAHRAHKVEHERVGHIVGRKHYASGGGVPHGEEDTEYGDDREVAKIAERKRPAAKAKMRHGGKAEGHKTKHRLDRHHRARGGRTEHADASEDRAMIKSMVKPKALRRASGGRAKGKGKTTVNVIISSPAGGAGPHAQLPPPGLPGPVAAPPPPPPMPPRPPMAGPPGPGMPPPGLGGGMPPPGMMPPVRAKGGRIKKTPAFESGNRNGTQVQHTDGKIDGPNIGRGKPITYARGGRTSIADGPQKPARPPQFARGGPIGDGAQRPARAMEPVTEGRGDGFGPQPPVKERRINLRAGSKSGVGRLRKNKMERSIYP